MRQDTTGTSIKYTPRVTYIRDALHESIAVIPTRQLVNAQIVNYSKENKLVPAIVKVGVSYLNNPKTSCINFSKGR